MNPKCPRSPLHFYVLPRPVAVQIFTLLPLASILACTRASRRIHTLITRCPEMRTHLFQEPPNTEAAAAGPVALHPVFSRLSFSAFHSAKAIRLAAGSGRFLATCAVRHRFATAPALAEVVVRVVSGGAWPLDVEIAVSKKEGVTVWDVVDGVTGLCVSHVRPSPLTDVRAASTTSRRFRSASISASISARTTNGIRKH